MPRWLRVHWAIFGLGLALAWGSAAPASLQADPPAAKVLWSKTRSFSIPVTVDPKQRSRTREMLLWASDDLGERWARSGKTDPDHPSFAFRAPRDGEYWFAVQTVNKDGGFWPAGDRPVQPAIKVIVDSSPPIVTLESRGRRGSQAAVQWEVQDDHLDLKSLVLEYQAEGVRDWRQVPLARDEAVRIGYKSWDAGTAEALRVRLSIRDFAGNSRSVDQGLPDGLASEPNPNLPEAREPASPPPITPISNRSAPTPSADGARSDPFEGMEAAAPTPASLPPSEAAPPPVAHRTRDRAFEEAPGTAAAPVAPVETPAPVDTAPPARRQMLLVKSPRFPLKYEVTDAGPAGPALVELWVTRDGGRNWNRQAEDVDHQSPYNVDLGNEGTFGLWLVVQSAAGLGELPPAPGDAPQMWVEVDSSPPAVTLERPKIGTGKHAGKVAIDWKVDDAHPDPRPISLYYRPERPDAPWVKIIDRIENSGHYVWTVPASVPPRFHLRIDAVDALGNRSTADSTELGPVVLDRARPRGKIVGLDPSAQGGQDGVERR